MKKLHSLTLVGLLALTPITRAAIITVNTADNADFTAGKTNLVTALLAVNDGDTIAFNIPGAGPHYLQTPVDGYPVLIKDNVTINGYSQPLSKFNSNPITAANNADLRIVLDSRNGNYRIMAYELFTPANSSPPIDNSSMATERSGYGTTEVAILGIYRATNANIRGMAFLGQATGDPSTYAIAVAHDYGLDTTVKDRLEYNDGSSRGCHINGCWFGIDPTNQTVAGLAPAQSAVAFFRHRDVSGGTRPELPNEGLIVGVKPGAVNPRSQFNVMAYHFLSLAGEAIRTRFSGNFLGVLPDGLTPSGLPAQFAGGIEIGRYNDTNAIVLGTDGDGVNDADEGNLFGPFGTGDAVFALYSTGDKPYIAAGNRFGIDINGAPWATTNSQSVWDGISGTTKVQFGSDFDGVSDAWEANVIYNNYLFASVFPDPSTTLEPRMLVISAGAQVSFRGNVTVNNNLIPFDYADGVNGRTTAFTNYEAPYMDTGSANGIIPNLSTNNVYPNLSGTFAPGIAPYTNIIVDVYQLDPEGWANGKLFGLTELTDGVTYTNGFPQGKKFLGSFAVANTGSFNINATGLDFGPGAVTVTVNYSADAAGTHNGRVHTSNFSTPAYVIPGGAASVGVTRIVPDVLVWWNSAGNYVTNGSINNLADQTANLGNWEPNISVLGDSTFLIGANTFANDGAVANQNYVVTLQPAAGGAPKVVYHYYTDTNTPFKGQINLSRQNGNPQRVAGDKRIGAVNYITAAEVSVGQLPEFQSDSRWTTNPIYADINRYVAVQPFSLDTATLVPMPLHKAFDAVYGQFATVDAPASQPQVSRTGGTVACLDNGNFVVTIDDRSGYTAAGTTTTFGIITPGGTVVRTNTLVVAKETWDNVAAYKGGFAVRSQDAIYFYNNAGDLQGSTPTSSSGAVIDSGRGDGTRIASDIRSKYVYLAARSPNAAASAVVLYIWDADTRAFVTSAQVSDTDPTVNLVDRINLAVDALDRICVAYVLRPNSDFALNQVAARVMKFDGATVSFLTHSFFPFVNYDPTGTLGLTTIGPSVAMTLGQICIAAKGTINSTNTPTGGPNTAAETTLYTVISNPGGVPEPLTITSITADSTDVVITWAGGTGPFLVQGTAALGAAPVWADLQTTTSRTARIPRALPMTFFRIQDGTTKTVSLFKSVLNGANERPTPVVTPGFGIGLLALDGTTASYWITYSGLTVGASAAHLHGPADATTTAGVMFGLGSVSGTAGVISGTATVTAPQAASIAAGNSYFNIHTPGPNAGGEIRGQLLLLP